MPCSGNFYLGTGMWEERLGGMDWEAQPANFIADTWNSLGNREFLYAKCRDSESWSVLLENKLRTKITNQTK